jgi:hypothetical protein
MKVSSQDWELRSELRRPAREGREQMQRTKIKLEKKKKKEREREKHEREHVACMAVS